MLYVVGTPIGNMEDITLRALKLLREVPLIAAEDTRKTRRLLERHGIRTKLTSFHDHSGKAKLERLVEHLRNEDMALVSEAGMPNISDPGHELISAAIENSVPVVAVPGPTALIAALSTSGMPTSQFTFLGFLPRKRADRKALLESALGEGRTVVAYETPHRLRSALQDISEVAPDVEVAVCRELTKLHEEVLAGPAADLHDQLAGRTRVAGEMTLLVTGHRPRRGAE